MRPILMLTLAVSLLSLPTSSSAQVRTAVPLVESASALIARHGGLAGPEGAARTAARRPAVFTVTTAADAGAGSLRQAIIDANAAAGPDEIRFAIPGNGPHAILLASELPVITSPVAIDGYSQSGAAPASGATPAQLRVALIGSLLSTGEGLVFVTNGNGANADGSSVRGLSIYGFETDNRTRNGAAILVEGASGVTVAGNHIGIDVDGSTAPSSAYGVVIFNGGSGGAVGGTASADRNVIGGHTLNGVIVAEVPGVSVQGNYIGTNPTATSAVGNRIGLSLANAPGAVVGSAVLGEGGNVIGGNLVGIDINGASSSGINVVGNLVGVRRNAATGAIAPLSNLNNGVQLSGGASENVVQQNGIGFNGGAGVYVTSGATGTRIVGNLVGGNQGGGIHVTAENSITAPSGTVIQGNGVGAELVASGAAVGAVGNVGFGIRIHGLETLQIEGTVIGGGPGQGNLVSGTSRQGGQSTGGDGIVISHAIGTVVQGNLIGTDRTGRAALPNVGNGLLVTSDGVLVGGVAEGEGNVIAANGAAGVLLSGQASGLYGNVIGTDRSESLDLGNGGGGVVIFGGTDNTVGFDAPGHPNVIAYNAVGVSVGSGFTGADRNVIRANRVFANDGLGIDLGEAGVTANDANDHDGGPNRLQNFPVLTAARLVNGGASLEVQGTLESTTGDSFTIDFYASAVADPSGYGEGARYLGSLRTSVPSGGTASFGTLLDPVAPGEVVTATATPFNGPSGPSFGGTSEFSAAVTVDGQRGPALLLALTSAPTGPVAPGSSAAFGFSVTDDASPAQPVNDVDLLVDAGYDTDGDGDIDQFVSGETITGFDDGNTYALAVPANAPAGAVLVTRFAVEKSGYTASESVTASLTVASAAATARVQLTHASDGLAALGPIDVYVDGALVADDLTHPRATGFVTLPVGRPLDVRIELASPKEWYPSSAPRSFSLTRAIPEPGVYSLTLAGTLPELLPVLQIDPAKLPAGRLDELAERFVTVVRRDASASRTAANGVVLYAVHASTDAPALDVALAGSGPALADNLAFGTASPFVSVPVGLSTVEVRDATGGQLLGSFALDLTGASEGDTLQISVTGFVDPSIVGAPGAPPPLRTVAVDETGAAEPGRPTAGEAGADSPLALHGVHPNPAAGTVEVTFTLSRTGPVRLAVYDVLGREVAVLADGERAPGAHRARLDASALAPGLYVLRLDAEGTSVAQQLTAVR